MSTSIKPKIVKSTEGTVTSVVGQDGRAIMRGDDTGGLFSLSEIISDPEVGPPYHVHSREDETFFILEGAFEFIVDGKRTVAKPGDTVFGARNVPHTFKCVGTQKGRLTVLCTPAGFEKFFDEVTERNKVAEMTPPELTALAAEYGCTILGPPPAE